MEGVWGMAVYFDQVKYTKFSGGMQGEGVIERWGDWVIVRLLWECKCSN